MLVELANHSPQHIVNGEPELLDGSRITYVKVDEGAYPLTPGSDVNAVARHLIANPDVTRLPGLEALLSIVHPGRGLWAAHSGGGVPGWVRVTGADAEQAREMERLLSELYGCPVAPQGVDDLDFERALEEEFHTHNGVPGVGFDPLGHVTALKTNAGNDIQAWQMFNAGQVLGQTGTATATSATTLTGGTESPGGSHATNDAAGMTIVAWGTGVYGRVVSNTSGTSPVYTVDRWYTPGSPGGAAAATPGTTTGYTLLAGGPPAFFMGLTATATAPGSGDTTLAGEITTASGGLIRKICPTAHTAGVASCTLTPVFTANASDSLPVTVAKIGVSQSMVSTVNNLFQTLLNATATLSAIGDQLTVTETVTM